MKIDITDKQLEAIFRQAEPFELEGAAALQDAYDHPHTIFPSVDGLSREDLLRMAIDVRNYTERTWRITNRLRALQPEAATNIYIPEFGL